jgi:neutral ceramidase
MTARFLAGAAVIDITPPIGLAMSGFSARTSPATGTHDALTARALAVDDTAIVAADVVGLDEESCRRIRARSTFADDHVVVVALHTHGGPQVMPGRLGDRLDQAYLARLEDACVEAVRRAIAAQRPAELLFGHGADPGIARNRRHPGGPVDPALPFLRVRGLDGAWIAGLVAYACHPVVLGPDNTLWTADYPGYVRSGLERAHPDAVAIFLTGCTGDANTGHSAYASFSTAPDANRTFAAAERHGARVVEAALLADAWPLTGAVRAASTEVVLHLERRESDPPVTRPLDPWIGRVSVLDWGGMRLVALPGEIFATTALDVRMRLDGAPLGGPSVPIAYADGCPGYFPPAAEYAHGGYEVDEAHRYYGMPAAFAPGSAERLADAAVALAGLLSRP